MVVLQNSMDSQKNQPGSCNETCHTSSADCNQIIGIKVEEVTSIKEEESPQPISFPIINTEHEVSYISVCPLLCTSYRYWELPFLSLFVCLLYIKCLKLENGFWRIISKISQRWLCFVAHYLWHTTSLLSYVTFSRCEIKYQVN